MEGKNPPETMIVHLFGDPAHIPIIASGKLIPAFLVHFPLRNETLLDFISLTVLLLTFCKLGFLQILVQN